jgi:hypothetical protein
VRLRFLLAGVLVLTLASLPGAAQSASEAELDGLTAVLGQVRKVDREERIVVVDRVQVYVPERVRGFDRVRPGHHVVVHVDPESKRWTAVAIEVLP